MHSSTRDARAVPVMGFTTGKKSALSRTVGAAMQAGSSGADLGGMVVNRFVICCLSSALLGKSRGIVAARLFAGCRSLAGGAGAGLGLAVLTEGGEGVAGAARPLLPNPFDGEENFHIAQPTMNDLHNLCPQCMLPNDIDCQESGCPKKEGGAEVACMDGPAMKMFTQMGLRICYLENLIVRAAGCEPDDQEDKGYLEMLREALRILGKKKKGSDFDQAWADLAKLGACDSIGGMEYHRVLKEWEQYRGTDTLETFIKRQANLGPNGEQLSTLPRP